MKFKIRNTKSNTWIQPESCYWKFKDLFPTPIYDDIEMIPSTGIKVNKKVVVEGVPIDAFVEVDLYAGDIVKLDGFESYYKVEYITPKFILRDISTDAIMKLCTRGTMEQVGNVYDNPNFPEKD